MKRIFIFVLFFYLSSLFALGQVNSHDREGIHESFQEIYNVVDTAYMEVVYSHSMFDPVKKEKDIVYEMLSLGDTYSRYTDYIRYKEDSLSNTKAGEKYWWMEWYDGPHRNLLMTYGSSRESVMKSYKDSTMHLDGLMMGCYYYEEPLHQMEWVLADDTKEILGHECRKATCRWRGREWTAWYSELPYSDGPWMFGGLPGLIMELTDATGEHKIRAKGIKRDVYPFGLNKRRSDFRAKRERYRKMLEEYVEDMAGILMKSGMVTSGLEKEAAKPTRLFYCPLELE